MALTSDGTILVNVAHSNGPGDPKSLLKRALEAGGQVFIGVVVTTREVAFARKWIDDSSWELAGHVWGSRGRTRKAKKAGRTWPKK
jgi:hypothetical protein